MGHRLSHFKDFHPCDTFFSEFSQLQVMSSLVFYLVFLNVHTSHLLVWWLIPLADPKGYRTDDNRRQKPSREKRALVCSLLLCLPCLGAI